jgi:hypothetical protein
MRFAREYDFMILATQCLQRHGTWQSEKLGRTASFPKRACRPSRHLAPSKSAIQRFKTASTRQISHCTPFQTAVDAVLLAKPRFKTS